MGQEWSQILVGDCPERDYTPPETITYMRKLLELDTEYGDCIRECLHKLMVFKLTDMKKPEDVWQSVLHPDTVKMAGSCSQGGCICRWFKHGILEVELDINGQAGSVPAHKENAIIQHLPDKPGFLKVYNGIETYECLHPVLRREEPEICQHFNTQKGETFVNTVNLQGQITKAVPFYDGETVSNKIALALGVHQSAVRLEILDKVQGPSNMSEATVFHHDEPFLKYSHDIVGSFRLERYPEEIKLSLERMQKFLPSRVMTDLKLAHIHIVPKKSPGSVDEEEWRQSTTEMEHILMKTWCEQGHDEKMVCYFTLKCLFYRYIRGIEVSEKHIPSYALKTVMFWMVEKMDSSEWTEPNFMENMRKVLIHLKDDLKHQYIPNYFIHGMNIIDPKAYPLELTEAAVTKLEEMASNLEMFMPRDLEKKIKQGNNLLSGVKVALTLINYRKIKAELQQVESTEEALQMVLNSGLDMVALIQGILFKKI